MQKEKIGNRNKELVGSIKKGINPLLKKER